MALESVNDSAFGLANILFLATVAGNTVLCDLQMTFFLACNCLPLKLLVVLVFGQYLQYFVLQILVV